MSLPSSARRYFLSFFHNKKTTKRTPNMQKIGKIDFGLGSCSSQKQQKEIEITSTTSEVGVEGGGER
jgi:hypothetical protein